MVNSEVSKFFCVNFEPNNMVYSANLDVYTPLGFGFFTTMQSWIHEYWARKYCSFLDTRLKYSPGNAFETFPFPDCLRPGHPADEVEERQRAALEAVGRDYYDHRKALMRDLDLGLTKTYNLFHTAALTEATVAEALRKSGGAGTVADCLARIEHLRALHTQMDLAVLKAYSWVDIKPGHGFHDLDFLPVNDRTRYTIAPEARREVLERLLELNYRRHGEEGGFRD